MNREEYDANSQELLKYSTNPTANQVISLISQGPLSATIAATSADPPPSEISNPSLEKIVKVITSIVPNQDNAANAKFTSEILTDLENLLSGNDVKEETKKEVEETIRITPHKEFSGKKELQKHFINNTYLHGDDKKISTFTLDMLSSNIASLYSGPKDVPTKQKPAVSVIELLKPGIGATGRDTRSISIFTGMVNATEMSRCVPFLRLKIIPPTYVDEQQVPIRTPAYFNIMGFLKGDAFPQDIEIQREFGNRADAALSVTLNADGKEVDGGGSMEIFTTPQTMMTTRPNLANFSSSILDRSRPFMTLTSVKMTVTPSVGWYTHKTANIEMVLHDRSRLASIAPFIKPDIFAGSNKAVFEIEYGWSHPDGDRKVGGKVLNPIGAFLHGLRCKENYEVYNSTYSFAESGQVNISLQLTMRSHSAILSKIPEITDVKSKIDEIDAILKSVNQTMKNVAVQDKTKDNLKEIFGEIIMNGVGSMDSALSMDLTKFEELRKSLEAIKKTATPDAPVRKLADEITSLVTAVNQAQNTSANAAQKRLETLIAAPEIFPAVASGLKKVAIPTRAAFGPVTKNTVSLGSILYTYIAAPLAYSNEFDEVQLIFGVHNDRASYMRSLSIARHPIDIESFKSDVTEFAKKKPKMTIADFISMLNEKHLSNDYAFAYGFTSMKPQKDKDGKEIKPDLSSIDKQSKIIIEDVGIKDGNYRKPNLKITPECVTGPGLRLILRLHVVDTTAVSYQSYVDLLKASRDVQSNAVNALALDTDHPLLNNAPEYRWVRKKRSELINYLEKRGALKVAKVEEKGSPTGGTDTKVAVSAMSLVDDAKSLKRVISKGLPYIRFGQTGGMVTNIGVTGLSDPGLANAALSVAGKKSTYTSAIEDQKSGIPMRVTPAEISMEMLGCPLINHMQCFFIDLDTMTSLDGIYTVSGVEHSLTPGSFNTSVKLINTGDGYSSFRSIGNDLSTTVSRWLQVDPDAKKAVETATKQDQAKKKEQEKTKKAKEDAAKVEKEKATKAQLESAIDARAKILQNDKEAGLNSSLTDSIDRLMSNISKLSHIATILQNETNRGVALTNTSGNFSKFLQKNAGLNFKSNAAAILYGLYDSARNQTGKDPGDASPQGLNFIASQLVFGLEASSTKFAPASKSKVQDAIIRDTNIYSVVSYLDAIYKNKDISKHRDEIKKKIESETQKK